MTKPYAEVIGDPIAHSKSPLIHNFWLGKLGIDAEYRACHVRPEELADYFAVRRKDPDWRGCNVTIPHKESVLEFADEQDSSVEEVGAANCITPRDGKLLAFNTDVDGIREALFSVPAVPLPENYVATEVEIIGSGGAARAAGAACRIFGDMTFYNRTIEKARKLADEFMSPGAADGFAGILNDLPKKRFEYDPHFPAMKENRGNDQHYCYILINSSSMGMKGLPDVPVNLDWYPEDTIVFDMVYAPLETRLLKEARDRGMRTIDGLVMLIGQAAAAFERFFAQPAPRECDAELRELLTR